MKLDVHHHVAPEFWLSLPGGTVDEPRVFGDWSPTRAVEEMDRDGVATGFASFPLPGGRFADRAVARTLSRRANEYMAQLRADYPGRFGMFALLPMPDLDDALAEIAYAYDQLKTDGINLLTSYGGAWIGNPRFDPLFEELNRRKAVVFVHPCSNAACSHRQEWLGPSAIDYATDTTRAIAEYVFGGSSQRYPNVRMIFSHAGGTMPYLAQRFIHRAGRQFKDATPDGFLAEARKLYYDTAQVPNSGTMFSLKSIVTEANILFGSDYPYRTCGWTAGMLEDGKVFDSAGLEAIFHGNAARLLKMNASDSFEDHCWRDVVSPEALELYRHYRRETYVGESAALLAIDLYELAYQGGALPVAEVAKTFPSSCGEYAHAAIAPTQRLFAAARAAGLPIFYTTSETRADARPKPVRATQRRGVPSDPSVWNIRPEFAPQPGDTVVRKMRASGFYGTPLTTQLTQLGIKSVIVCGESTSGCVRASAVDAYSAGYHVVLAEEACFDRYLLAHKMNLFDMHHKYADVMHVEDIVAELASIA